MRVAAAAGGGGCGSVRGLGGGATSKHGVEMRVAAAAGGGGCAPAAARAARDADSDQRGNGRQRDDGSGRAGDEGDGCSGRRRRRRCSFGSRLGRSRDGRRQRGGAVCCEALRADAREGQAELPGDDGGAAEAERPRRQLRASRCGPRRGRRPVKGGGQRDEHGQRLGLQWCQAARGHAAAAVEGSELQRACAGGGRGHCHRQRNGLGRRARRQPANRHATWHGSRARRAGRAG